MVREDQHADHSDERVPAFDDELRRSMFEEPVRFFVDLVQNDRPVSEFVDGKQTFVNAALGHGPEMLCVDGLDQPAWPVCGE